MFYAAAMLLLTQGAAEQPPAGYSFMPFLMIAMLGVFPLTLTWGGGLTAMVVLVHLVVVAFLGQWTTADAVDRLWVLLMVGGITVWIQSGQLLMLMKLYRESTEDPLTGMINRRALMKRLATEIAYVSNGKPTFCILMFDLDRFKKVNDNHGHLVGDKVLKTAAKLLQGGVREHDIVARFGGEEFIAVLPESTSEEAMEVAERIRRTVEGAHVTTSDGERISLSTSVGVTAYEMPEAIEETFNRADGSLFKAKVMGRNRVVQSQSDRVPLAEPS
jgi:diguanylate cyclase (GGDEF)-like protein